MKKAQILPLFLQNGFLSLKFKFPDDLLLPGETDTYWSHYDCDIVIRYYDGADDNKEDLVVGNFSAYHYHTEMATMDGYCDYDGFNTYDTDNFDQYSGIIWNHDTRELSKEFVKATGCDFLSGDFFILMSLNIFPEYRGYDLGNAVTWLFYRNFCRYNDILMLLAFPLQFGLTSEEQNKCKPGEFTGSQQECTKRLANYYKKLGFRRIGRSDFYFFLCEYTMKRPDILDHIG